MSETASTDTLLQPTYVVADPKRRDARVVRGPVERDEAESIRTAVSADAGVRQVALYHLAQLVYVVDELGFEFGWADCVDRPEQLVDESDESDVDHPGRGGGQR